MKKFPKRLFNKMFKASVNYGKIKSVFDKMVIEVYGMHYSDVDDDWLIDALDYGTGYVSYDDFCCSMTRHSEEYKYHEESE